MAHQKRYRARSTLLSRSPLLITEHQDDFDQIRDALNADIRPRGIVEQMYVADVAYLTWEILRLRRCKSGIVNLAYREALKDVLEQVLRKPGESRYGVKDEADELARKWFSGQDAKGHILELLKVFQLDEVAIEAEAIRKSAADLELVDKLLASLESRRNRAFRSIAEYRNALAQRLQEASSRVLEGKILALGSSPDEPAAA
jgi:hypothetical protein